MNRYKLLESILVVAILYAVCILQNFILGSFLVFLLLVKEIVDYKSKREKKKIYIIATAIVLVISIYFTYLQYIK